MLCRMGTLCCSGSMSRLALGSGLLMLFGTPAAAHEELYAGAGFVFSFTDAQDIGGTNLPPGPLQLQDDTVEIVVGSDLRLGYGFEGQGLPVRAELRYHYRYHYDFDLQASLQPVQEVRWDNTVTYHGLFADLFYDFRRRSDAIRPFLGVGLGYGWREVDTERTFWPGQIVTGGEASEGSFAWALTGGVSLRLGPDWRVEGAYRYSDLGGIESTSFPGGERVRADGMIAHDLTLGLLRRF